jgi:hypothetical protein
VAGGGRRQALQLKDGERGDEGSANRRGIVQRWNSPRRGTAAALQRKSNEGGGVPVTGVGQFVEGEN